MNDKGFPDQQLASLFQWHAAFGQASTQPSFLYALVDGVLDETVLPQIEEHGLRWMGLYPNTIPEAGSPQAGPWLAELAGDSDNTGIAMRQLLQHDQDKDFVLWITSRHRLPELARHFQSYAEVELPDRSRALLRYYDPSILAALLRTFTPEQCEHFLSAFQGCCFYQDDGLRALTGTDHDNLVPLPADIIALTREQQRILASECFAETLYYQIKADLQAPANELDSNRCIEHVRNLVTQATKEHRLKDQADLMMFALTGLNVSLKFHEHPDVADALRSSSSAREPLHAKLAQVNKTVWAELKRERPAL